MIHQANKGLSAARNAGLDIATGAFIAFVDSDDEIAPDMYYDMMGAVRETEADIAICGVREIWVTQGDDEKEQPEEGSQQNEHLPGVRLITKANERYRLLYDMWLIAVVQWNKLFKADIFRDLRFPEGRFHEDEYVILDELKCAQRIATVNQALYLYYRNPGSITMQRDPKRAIDAGEALLGQLRFFIREGESQLADKAYRRVKSFLAGTLISWKKTYPDDFQNKRIVKEILAQSKSEHKMFHRQYRRHRWLQLLHK